MALGDNTLQAARGNSQRGRNPYMVQMELDFATALTDKGSALAVSLADGSVVGEFKIFTNKGAGVATVTPSNFAAGTSFALAQNEGAQCVWDGANWFLVGNQSVTTVA